MSKVKCVIAFDRDNTKIGKTVELDEDEARVQIAEGRARLASEKGSAALRRPAGPTIEPPLPEVVGSPAATGGAGTP